LGGQLVLIKALLTQGVSVFLIDASLKL
jgi:hypothetical protein